jgi:hypothetical protein
MGKISEFFDKWGFVAFLSIVGVGLLFALGCCIYTSIINPFVGIVGTLSVVLALGGIALWAYLDIKVNNDTAD